MGLMKELNDLNAIYQKMNEGDGTYTVTKADKKGNTPAWQGYKSGKKNVKTGKPLYKAADHLKDEVEDNSPVGHYLDELKKATLASYAKKATTDLANRSFDHGESEKRQFEPDAADEKETKKQTARQRGIDRAADKLAKEETDFQPSEIVVKLVESGKFSKEEIWKIVEVEEETVKKSQTLDELKKSTLGSYIAKGSKDLANRRFDQGDSEKRKYEPDEEDDKEDKKLDKREQGIARAAKKLSKEGYQRNPEKGEEEERKRNKKVPGERTPMPPRGDKRREDFERWYAANVR